MLCSDKAHEFKSETKQLLDIVVNSLYTDKEVFVRELVSNASDACEKARYMQVTEGEMADTEVPLEVRITIDAEANTLTVEDSGIGMSKDEMIGNLGTIARSGSKNFVQEHGKAVSIACPVARGEHVSSTSQGKGTPPSLRFAFANCFAAAYGCTSLTRPTICHDHC